MKPETILCFQQELTQLMWLTDKFVCCSVGSAGKAWEKSYTSIKTFYGTCFSISMNQHFEFSSKGKFTLSVLICD